MKERPLVSVYMTTYYHEQYIEQAIESVLKQNTNFPFEIVISDDCSKDGTVDVLKEYEKKYDFIRVNYNPENLGLTKNQFAARSMCSGEFIIPLSGDDYWIDENKLQKQVDFLKAHRDYVGVATVIEERVDNLTIGSDWYPPKRYIGKRFTLEMFLKGENYPMNGILMRNFMLDEKARTKFSIMPEVSPFIDDVTDCILLLQLGDVFILPDVTVAYRVRRTVKEDKNFNSQNRGLLNYLRHIDMLNSLDKRIGESVDLINRYAVVVTNGLLKSILLRQFGEFQNKYKMIPLKYRKRGLMIKCILRIPKDSFIAIRNRISVRFRLIQNERMLES